MTTEKNNTPILHCCNFCKYSKSPYTLFKDKLSCAMFELDGDLLCDLKFGQVVSFTDKCKLYNSCVPSPIQNSCGVDVSYMKDWDEARRIRIGLEIASTHYMSDMEDILGGKNADKLAMLYEAQRRLERNKEFITSLKRI